MSSNNKKVLIIDDEPGIIEFMEMALQAHGYEVLSAQSGEEGLGLAYQKHPDIILLDIMMPGIDGFEVCRQLKANENSKDIPVLMVSAKAQSSDVEMGLSAGAQDYVIKPFEMRDLLVKIEKYLKT